MSNDQENKTSKMYNWYLRLRLFNWIDNHPSESTKKIIQSAISTCIGASILGTTAFIYTHIGNWIPNPHTTISLLKTPIQLQIWILALLAAALTWFPYYFHSRKLRKLHKVEMEKLTVQFQEQSKQDPKFLEVINYVIDENRAKGLRTIIEKSIGAIDKAVPIIQKSETFNVFMANAGVTLDISDSVSPHSFYPQMSGLMSFGVPSFENPFKYDMATFVVEKNKVLHLNIAANKHFDWSYATFKRQFDSDFETGKQKREKRNTQQLAIVSIYNKLVYLLNSYQDCKPLIELSPEEGLKARLANFKIKVAEFREVYEKNKPFIPDQLANDFLELANKTVEYARRNGKVEIILDSKPISSEAIKSQYDAIDALERDIPLLRQLLDVKIKHIMESE